MSAEFESRGGQRGFHEIAPVIYDSSLANSIRGNICGITRDCAVACYTPTAELPPADNVVDKFIRMDGASGEPDIIKRDRLDSNYRPTGDSEYLIDTPEGFFIAKQDPNPHKKYDETTKRGPIGEDDPELLDWADRLDRACSAAETGFKAPQNSDIKYCANKLRMLSTIMPNVPFLMVMEWGGKSQYDSNQGLIENPFIVSNIVPDVATETGASIPGEIYVQYRPVGMNPENKTAVPLRTIKIFQYPEGNYGIQVLEEAVEDAEGILADDIIFGFNRPKAPRPLNSKELSTINNLLGSIDGKTMLTLPDTQESLSVLQAIELYGEELSDEPMTMDDLTKMAETKTASVLEASQLCIDARKYLAEQASKNLNKAAQPLPPKDRPREIKPEIELYGQSGPAELSITSFDSEYFEIEIEWPAPEGPSYSNPRLLIRAYRGVLQEAFVPSLPAGPVAHDKPKEIKKDIYHLISEGNKFKGIMNDLFFKGTKPLTRETAKAAARFIRYCG